jgi:hypothetical protein
MSSSIYKYVLKVQADTRKPVSNIKRLDRQTDKASKSMSRFQKNTSAGVGSLKNFAAAAGVAFSVGAIVSFTKESMRLYDVQAKAEGQLLTALKGRQGTQQRLIKQAQELQKITLFGDEETIRAQSLIAAFVKEEEAIKRVIPLVQDMAAAKGMDLAGAADLVSKTLGSSTNALSRYGIEVTGAVGSTERLESLTKGLSDAFEGQARTAAELGTGPLTQLGNKWGDIREEIGETVVTSNDFKESIATLNTEMERLPGFLEKTAKTMNAMSTATDVLTGKIIYDWIRGSREVKEETEDLNNEVIDISEKIAEQNDVWDSLFNTLKSKGTTTYGDLTAQIAEKNKLLKEADITDTAYVRTLYAEIEALNKKKEAFEALANPMQQVIAPDVSIDTNTNTELPGLTMSPMENPDEGMQAFTDSWNEQMAAREARYQEHQQKIQAINQSLQGGFSQLGNSVVESMGLADEGFAGFVKGLASTATELISMWLAQSIAASVSNATQSAAATGPAAIVTQPAFLATLIGGVMSAFAAIPKFEYGGVVPGTSYSGDNILARVNSGEEVLRRDDPRHSYNQTGTRGGGGGSQINLTPEVLRIGNDAIYIAFKKHERKLARAT